VLFDANLSQVISAVNSLPTLESKLSGDGQMQQNQTVVTA
jgi:hypothetical protein